MIGTVKQSPSPIPARAWYPIHTLCSESTWSLNRSPVAIVLITSPAIRNGLKIPTAPIVIPTIIWVRAILGFSNPLQFLAARRVNLLRPNINGRVRIPDSIASVPLTAWK